MFQNYISSTARCFDNVLLLHFDSILRYGIIRILSLSLTRSQWQQTNLQRRLGLVGLVLVPAYSLASSAFLALAVGTLALQNRILSRISDLNDTVFGEYLAF